MFNSALHLNMLAVGIHPVFLASKMEMCVRVSACACVCVGAGGGQEDTSQKYDNKYININME